MRSLLSSKGNKRGMVTAKIGLIIGLLIIVVILTAVAPTMFNGSNNITGAPGWFTTVYPLMIGAAIVLFLWRAMS